jgi:uncharacterized protein YbjT (DUF2867 family)
VIGALGQTGGAVCEALLLSNHKSVMKVTCGVSALPPKDKAKSDRLKSFQDNGALVSKIDLNNVASMSEAFKGQHAVFITVPTTEDRGKLGVNAVKAAKAAKVAHVVVLSVQHADEGTSFGKSFKMIENEAKESGLKYTFLRCSSFMENYMMMVDAFAEGIMPQPLGSKGKAYPIAVMDIGIAGAAVINHLEKWDQQTIGVHGAALTGAQQAEALSKGLGVDIKYVDQKPEEFEKSLKSMKMPDWVVKGMSEMMKFYRENPGKEYKTRTFEQLTGANPRSVETWAKQNRDRIVPKGGFKAKKGTASSSKGAASGSKGKDSKKKDSHSGSGSGSDSHGKHGKDKHGKDDKHKDDKHARRRGSGSDSDSGSGSGSGSGSRGGSHGGGSHSGGSHSGSRSGSPSGSREGSGSEGEEEASGSGGEEEEEEEEEEY